MSSSFVGLRPGRSPPPPLPPPPFLLSWWIRHKRGSVIVYMFSWKGWIWPSAKTQLRRKVICRLEVRIYRKIEEILTLWLFLGFYCLQDRLCIIPCPKGAYCVRDKLVNATVSFFMILFTTKRVERCFHGWFDTGWVFGQNSLILQCPYHSGVLLADDQLSWAKISFQIEAWTISTSSHTWVDPGVNWEGGAR